jgi:DNA-directed RNA polymerase specialized sigma24 family protein
MTMQDREVELIVRESFIQAYKNLPAAGEAEELLLLVLKSAVVVAQEEPSSKETLTFEELDATIRGDPTQSGVFDQLTDPQRNRLLWEMKQGCLTAVVNCLPPGERVAFILSEIMGLPSEQAAAVLQITPSALRVRVSRASQKISSYLTPRCEHVNPNNPCHCPSRLGCALSRGFIDSVRGKQISLRARPFDEELPKHDPVVIFRTLPAPDPPQELLDELLRDFEAGKWDSA